MIVRSAPIVEERRVRRQAGVFTCLTVRWRCLVVELQRKLDVSRRLREVNNSSCGCIYICVRRGEVNGIKCIQEVRAELELKSLCDLEVFLQTDIPFVVSGSAQMTELGCTGPESSRWVGIVAGIKPGEATTLRSSSVSPTPDSVSSVAIGAQTRSTCSRWITYEVCIAIGNPECRERIGLTVQPPTTTSATLFMSLPNFFPRPNGKS